MTHMLAMDPPTPGQAATIYFIAIALFVLAAILTFAWVRREPPLWSRAFAIACIGLAVAFVVPFWNSLAAS